MRATVVILVKVPGHLPVKTRLVPRLGEAGARALALEMLRESCALARHFDPLPTVAFSPPDADAAAVFGGLGACRFLPLVGDGGARCLEEALNAAADGRALVALGGDAPDLPRERVSLALAALEHSDVVLVPTGDGGFSCLVTRGPVPDLAEGFLFGGDDALSALTNFLRERGLRVAHVEPWPDVDTPEQLDAWRARADAAARRESP